MLYCAKSGVEPRPHRWNVCALTTAQTHIGMSVMSKNARTLVARKALINTSVPFKSKHNRELKKGMFFSHGQYLTRRHTNTFTSLSIFSPEPEIRLLRKSGRDHCSGMRNVHFWLSSVARKGRLFKLPITYL